MWRVWDVLGLKSVGVWDVLGLNECGGYGMCWD